MKKHKITHTLQNGICEITYTDEYSVEHSMIGTLAHTHLPHDCDTMDIPDDQNLFVVFNVNTENWETYSAHRVIDVEQLTGEGAAVNKKKLQAGDEFIAQLELFTEQEFEELELEHPDDSAEKNA